MRALILLFFLSGTALLATSPNSDFFIANNGQIGRAFRFTFQSQEMDVLFREDAVDYVVRGNPNSTFRVVFHNARAGVVPQAEGVAGPRVLYALPHVTEKPVTASTAHRIRYRNLWPGIDLVYRLDSGSLKYELHVAPGSNPQLAAFRYENVAPRVNSAGELLIPTAARTLIDKSPVADQAATAVPVSYALTRNVLRFRIGKYDRSRPLRIDPSILVYTRLFGSGAANAVATDPSGQAYLAGRVESALPVIPSTVGSQLKGGTFSDAFIAKLDPSGANFVYLVLLGGSAADAANAIAVDGVGQAYVTGTTSSANFPTVNAFQSALSGASDGFVIKLNPSGNAIQFSTYLGGTKSEEFNGVAIDAAANVYVTGMTTSADYPKAGGFPSLGNAWLGDIAVTCLTPAGNSAIYSGLLGNFQSDAGNAIAVDASGAAYVAATTQSPLISSYPGFRANSNGGQDAAVFKVAPGGGSIVWMNFLGGSNNDTARGIAVDPQGAVYVTGDSRSADFALVPANSAFPFPSANGIASAFVAKIASDGASLAFTSFLGGGQGEEAGGIALDSRGRIHVIGTTYSSTLLGNSRGRNDTDAFHAMLTPDGKSVLCSRFIGGTWNDRGFGVAVDPVGNAYIAGLGSPQNFLWAASPDAYQTSGFYSAMAAKLSCSADCFQNTTSGEWFWWPMSPVHNQTTITPEMIAGRNAQLGGTPLPKFLPGVIGSSVAVGSQATLEVPHHSSLDLGSGSFSISTWLRYAPPNAFNFDDPLAMLNIALGNLGSGLTYDNEVVISKMKGFGLDDGRGFQLTLGASAPSLHLQNGTTAQISNCGGPVYPPNYLYDGQWHHVAAVVERSTSTGIRVRMFVDGKLACNPHQFAPNMAAVYDNSEPIRFGSPGSLDSFKFVELLTADNDPSVQFLWSYTVTWSRFSGLLDDTMLFKRALSDEEIASAYASNPRGNCSIPGCAGADLTATVRLTGALTVGGTANAIVTVRNGGPVGAPPSNGIVYLSNNANCQSRDAVLGQFTFGGLAPGGNADIAVPLSVNANAGNPQLCVVIDPNEELAECSRENNISPNGNVNVALACTTRPEFTISSFTSGTTSTSVGGSVSFDVALSNLGTGYNGTPPSTIRIFLSSDATLSANDSLIDMITVSGPPSGIPPRWTFTGRTAGIPSQTTAGSYFLIAVADGSSVVIECNEGNNTAVSKAFLVLPKWPWSPSLNNAITNLGPVSEPTLFTGDFILLPGVIGTANCVRVSLALEDESISVGLYGSLAGAIDYYALSTTAPGGRAAVSLSPDRVNAEFKSEDSGAIRTLTIPLRPNTPNQRLYIGLMVQSTGVPIRGKITVEPCVDRCQQAPSNLSAWWTLDQPEVLTELMQGIALLPTGNVPSAAGRVGQARRFDGNSHLQAADNEAFAFSENYSISLWYSADELPAGEMVLLDKRAAIPGAASRVTGFRLSLRGGRPGLLLGDAGGQEIYRATANVPAGTGFHLLTVTADRWSGVSWFVNGAQLGATIPWNAGESTVKYSPGPTIRSSAPLRFGRPLIAGDVAFRGSLDEVMIFSRVLTPSEIRAIFAAGAEGVCRPATTCSDYFVESVSAPSRVTNGLTTLRVQATIENTGATPAPATTLAVFLVAADRAGPRLRVGSIPVPAFAPQQSRQVSATFPLFVTPDTYRVVVEALAQGDCDSSNNSAQASNTTIVAAATSAGPDLVFLALEASPDPLLCNRVDLSATIGNQGTTMTAAERHRVGVYLSTDRTLTAADPLVAYCTMEPLAAGGTSQCSLGGLLIQNPGEYTLFARADDLALTSDVSRQNNTTSIPLTIRACPAN